MYKFIKGKSFWLFVLSALTFFMGAIGIYKLDLPSYLMIFPPEIGVLLLTVIVFAFGFMFFGYPSPLIMFFAGIQLGWVVKLTGQVGAYSVFGCLCCLLACYASVKLGNALLSDLAERGNFRQALKISGLFLLAALVIAAITDFLVVT